MTIHINGTPFVGSCSLTNGAPGPTNFSLFIAENQTTTTVPAGMRLVISSILISTNDTANPLVTIDDNGAGPRVLGKYYAASGASPTPDYTGYAGVVCKTATLPRASAAAVTAGKTVEITIRGFLTAS